MPALSPPSPLLLGQVTELQVPEPPPLQGRYLQGPLVQGGGAQSPPSSRSSS